MDLGCGIETWDTRLTLDESWSRVHVEVYRDAWENEPWFETSLTTMPCTHDLTLESSDLAPRAGIDLGFLMPGYSVWEWENFDLPEIIGSEVERCLHWHNLNAARVQYTAAFEVDKHVRAIHKQIFQRSEYDFSVNKSVRERAAGRAPQDMKRASKGASLLSRPKAKMLTAGSSSTQNLKVTRHERLPPFWRPSAATPHAARAPRSPAANVAHLRRMLLVTDI